MEQKCVEGFERLRNILIVFFEYALVATVIVECNSLFVYSMNYRPVSMMVIFGLCAVGIECVLILLYGLKDILGLIRKKWLQYLLMIIFEGAFFVLNVWRLVRMTNKVHFLLFFVMFFNLLCVILSYQISKGRQYDLVFKYSNLAVIIALLSLMVYIPVFFHSRAVFTDGLVSTWSGLSRPEYFSNYLNLVNLRSNTLNFFGFTVYKNLCFFNEPLMFGIPLITALYTEMFLRPVDKRSPWKWAVLLAALFTCQSTLDLMIAAATCGLKLLTVVPKKSRKFVFVPILGVVAVGCFCILKLKYGDSSTNGSVETHIEDFVIAFKAFMQHPIIGNGYRWEEPIQAFMTEERRLSNPGLSNSALVVLAHGGLIFGTFCFLPFISSLLQFRKKPELSLWTIGTGLLFCGTIFHYQLFLLFIMAVGYAHIDTGMFKALLKKRKVESVNETEGIEAAEDIAAEKEVTEIENTEKEDTKKVDIKKEDTEKETVEIKTQKPKADKKRIVGVCAVVLAEVALCVCPLFWEFIGQFMKTYQLYLSQSALKPFFFIIALLFCFAVIKEHGADRFSLLLVLYTTAFGICYPALYSCVSTLLFRFQNSLGDFPESFVIAGLYFAGYLAGYLILLLLDKKAWFESGKLSRAQGFIKLIPVLACQVLVLVLINTGVGVILPGEVGEVTVFAKDLNDAAAGRKVYCNENAALMKKQIPSLAYTTTRDDGFAYAENVSVIMDKDKDIRSLTDRGFSVASLSDGHILYSNDEAVIDKLSEKGYVFQMYYGVGVQPATEKSDAEDADYCTEERTIYGGKYYVSCDMELDTSKGLFTSGQPESIGKIRIDAFNGEQTVFEQEFYSDIFDETGKGKADFVIYTGNWYDSSVIYDGVDGISLKGVTITQIPDYIVRHTYNNQGQVTSEKYYTTDGQPMATWQGCFEIRYAYDRMGFTSLWEYFNENGEPVLITDGFSKVERSYTLKGWLLEEHYYGTDGKPILLPAVYSGVLYEYDKKGNNINVKYSGTDGNLILNDRNIAEIRRQFDDEKRVIAEYYYDTEGKACSVPEGYSGFKYEYDEQGNVNDIRYYGTDHNPVIMNANYAGVHRVFDEYRRVIREDYFGTDGNPLMLPEGYAGCDFGYDDRWNVDDIRYFGTDRNPIVMNANYAGIHRVFDEYGRVIREEYYGTDGNLSAIPEGYAIYTREYDGYGNLSIERFYGVNEEPVMTAYGFAQIYREYDAEAQLINEIRYDEYGNEIIIQ